MPTYVDIKITDARYSDLREGDTIIFNDGSVEVITGLRVWDEEDDDGGEIQFKDFRIDVFANLKNKDQYRRNSIETVLQTITLADLKSLLDNQP